jgi:hypothetical protein
MAVSNIPVPSTQTGKPELTPTDKRTLVMARDVMATVLDATSQARRSGMITAQATRNHNGRSVVVVAFAITGHDVVANREMFFIDGRAITDADAWADLRDVMAESETVEAKP